MLSFICFTAVSGIKYLFDLGIVSTDEPYKRLFNQGMILAFAYETESGSKVSGDLVEEREGKYYHKETGDELRQIVAKMSKSLKNVVNPDDVTSKYGADSLRLYEMFMGRLMSQNHGMIKESKEFSDSLAELSDSFQTLRILLQWKGGSGDIKRHFTRLSKK